MKGKSPRAPGKTAGIILIFMTILLFFPLVFYFRLSTQAADIIGHSQMEAGYFCSSLRFYLESLPPDAEIVAKKMENIPLIPNVIVRVYDSENNLVIERRSDKLEDNPVRINLYRKIKGILDPLRGLFREAKEKDPEEVKESLIEKALNGKRGIDYVYKSGEIGDRVLYYAYPLYLYKWNGHDKKVVGILLLEHWDESLKTILQKQRNQFALMCLIFMGMLIVYSLYILFTLVRPLRQLLDKSLAVIRRTEYLLPEQSTSAKNNEIGEITRSLDEITGMLDAGDREIEQYRSELRHVIRNPLSVIRVSLDGLMMDKNTEKDLRFSDIIQRNLSRIDSYISSYSGIPDCGVPAHAAEEVDIADILEDLLKNYSHLADRELVSFEIKISDAPLIWKGYSSHLCYAVEQIINNAIDFSPENGIILLEAKREKDSIAIIITDQGPGLPEGKEDEIFKRYVSYRKIADQKHTGTGLFLSMSVLKKIGSNISAGNANPRGAVFKITLPVG
ncbi:MAG: HAMP domain-containing sensor histidine kinase [Spirochaetales bacterium]|nr:HAMP domain-containing sensor histidine kinase [Spirochaetales bacterium]